MRDHDARRREFLGLTAVSVLGALAPLGCKKPDERAPAPALREERAADASVVRVVSVPTAVEGNLLPALAAAFEKESGLRVSIRSTDSVYDLARAGEADLAVSHYGHKHAEEFVLSGYGAWPRTLFSNQMALLGPKHDPANVRGLDDAVEAFRRIAAAKAPFVLNDIDGVRYLTEILWNAAGRPDRTGWLLDDRRYRKEDAARLAARKGAYTLWGLTPYLRTHEAALDLEPLVLGDPLLQRMLVSIAVKPEKVSGVNARGAAALETWLLSPATQAHIREVRYPGDARVTWVPGGRHNRTAVLPKS